MRDQYPPSDKCDFCSNKSTKQSDDGADCCNKCWKENVVRCKDCKTTMVWSVTIYTGHDDKSRCQLCDQEHEVKWERKHPCWS